MYTAAALTGVIAGGGTPTNIAANIELAKAYGYAMIKAQKADAIKRDIRAKVK